MTIAASIWLTPRVIPNGEKFARYKQLITPTIVDAEYVFTWPQLQDDGPFRPRSLYVRASGNPLYACTVITSAGAYAVRGNDVLMQAFSDRNLIVMMQPGQPLTIEIVVSDSMQPDAYVRRQIYSARFAKPFAWFWRGACLSSSSRLELSPFANFQASDFQAPGFPMIINFAAWDGSRIDACELIFDRWPNALYLSWLAVRIGINAILHPATDPGGAGPSVTRALRVGKITSVPRAPLNLAAGTVKALFDTARISRDYPFALDSIVTGLPSFSIPVTFDADLILPPLAAMPLTPAVPSMIYIAGEFLREDEII